jgi:hypothetical protein
MLDANEFFCFFLNSYNVFQVVQSGLESCERSYVSFGMNILM